MLIDFKNKMNHDNVKCHKNIRNFEINLKVTEDFVETCFIETLC